jgi:lysophospholipase L1-like esterase
VTQRPLATPFLVAALAAACGGGSPPVSNPNQETYTVTVIVFYDQNGNGSLDGGEAIRIPDAEVQIAGRSGRSEKTTGRAAIAGVPRGTYTLTVKPDTLPPFYAPGASVSVTVPQTATVNLPLTLPIGSNTPNLYMGFGDSITNGEGSQTSDGYKGPLQAKLQAHFGGAVVIADEGTSGSKSDRGAGRIDDSLARVRPAFTLILYGTNDWNRSECRDAFPCFTLDSLRTIVRSTRAAQSLPFLATIVPTNPNFTPPERNEWVVAMNDLIRPLARQEGAVLVDLHAAFLKVADQPSLFADSVHPNDQGYAIIADEYFKAITRSASGSTSGADAQELFGGPSPGPPRPRSDPARSPGEERRVRSH